MDASWWSTLKMQAQSMLLLSSNFFEPTFQSPALNCTSSAFASFLPSNAKLSYAHVVPANGTWHKPSPPFPDPSTGLPELCAISINIQSSPTSSYNFGLFLPNKWNSRFMTSGNGGYGGGINWNDMGTHSHQGFASMSTDTGHISALFDAEWALNNPESQIDWGHRAMHGSVVLAKSIIQTYYASKIKYSYFSACSTGGRQGLKEVQKYPADFDGVIAAAPAWWTSHLQTWVLELSLWNLPATSPHHIPSSLIAVVGAEVLRQCDPQDGIVDGIISNPAVCNFHLPNLLCGPKSKPETCLTAPQLQTLKKIYSEWTEWDNNFVFPAFPLGSEGQYGFSINTDADKPSFVGINYVENFLFNTTDPDYNWLKKENFNHSVTEFAENIDTAGATADDFDLRPFAERGGKLLMYHGWADGLIPATSSIHFYNSVLSKLIPLGFDKSKINSFFKFYLVPGMQHCWGSVGDAPWYINGASQAFNLGINEGGVPGFCRAGEERYDVVKTMMAWVEKGVEPGSLVATKWVDDEFVMGVRRQRVLCPYPTISKWGGVGDVDKAESWACKGLF